jgi:hypothetical protein
MRRAAESLLRGSRSHRLRMARRMGLRGTQMLWVCSELALRAWCRLDLQNLPHLLLRSCRLALCCPPHLCSVCPRLLRVLLCSIGWCWRSGFLRCWLWFRSSAAQLRDPRACQALQLEPLMYLRSGRRRSVRCCSSRMRTLPQASWTDRMENFESRIATYTLPVLQGGRRAQFRVRAKPGDTHTRGIVRR